MATRMEELLDVLRVPPGKKIDLKKDSDPGFTGKWMNKEEAKETLTEGIQMLAEMQDKLWAQDQYCTAHDPSGSRCSRQGRHYQARHVGSQPAGS